MEFSVATTGNLVFFSGMLPVVDRKPQYAGRVGGALTAEDGKKAAEVATLSALSAAKDYLGSLDKVVRIVKLSVYIATEGDFRDHPKVADGASELLLKVFGKEMLSGRVVLGVASIPLGMPVEIELVLEVDASSTNKATARRSNSGCTSDPATKADRGSTFRNRTFRPGREGLPKCRKQSPRKGGSDHAGSRGDGERNSERR
jgi:enamine deaminase RidA (YjgF/YER057c/UK114 family)